MGGRTDETDLGAPYGTIDAILSRFVDDGLSVPEVEAGLDVDGELVADLAAVHDGTEHKRSRPPPPSNRESS